MQRFQLMKVYVASVVMVLAMAITTAAWLRRARGAVPRGDVGAPPPRTGVTRPADDNAPPPARSADQVIVSIDNFTFSPRALTVPVGATVTWVNRDDVPHTATSSDGPAAFDSRAMDTDDRYSFTFTTPGTWNYFCKVHPHMTGSVTVR